MSAPAPVTAPVRTSAPETVTVVVPVHGKAGLTRHCLDSLLGQELPAGTRLLVVDDASPDDTAALLASYGERIDVLHLPSNRGFGAACNLGVQAARTELVVLLNNDTTPHPGWLHALLREAEQHPAAAAVGARLLHLDGTVQHAGVVFGRDRLPHHVYAGFPGDHAAVVRSRAFQVVTGACMLLRRSVFLTLGGFDLGYRNGHEDVDLCLRLREAGHEVRYCGDAVLTHLESVSRGRTGADQVANGRRYCDTWQDRVVPFHPADSEAAIAHLREQQQRGATHLVLPATAAWWLDHYPDFAAHLAQHGSVVVDDARDCRIYALQETSPQETSPQETSPQEMPWREAS